MPAEPYRNVNASVTRKVGSAMNVSMIRATVRAPGNGTKARTSASTRPSATQPAVAETAISTVLSSARRNEAERNTSAARANDTVPASSVNACRPMSARG
jgi:hypothetical protein